MSGLRHRETVIPITSSVESYGTNSATEPHVLVGRGVHKLPYKSLSAGAPQGVNQRKLNSSLKHCTHQFLTLLAIRPGACIIHPLMVNIKNPGIFVARLWGPPGLFWFGLVQDRDLISGPKRNKQDALQAHFFSRNWPPVRGYETTSVVAQNENISMPPMVVNHYDDYQLPVMVVMSIEYMNHRTCFQLDRTKHSTLIVYFFL